jgi:hypothetical protein
MSLFTEDAILHIPAMAREVYDVSGAGDTVIATLAVMLMQGKSLPESVMIANRAGGIVVGKLGTATVSRKSCSRVLPDKNDSFAIIVILIFLMCLLFRRNAVLVQSEIFQENEYVEKMDCCSYRICRINEYRICRC